MKLPVNTDPEGKFRPTPMDVDEDFEPVPLVGIAVEYPTFLERLDALENRLQISKRTVHEIIAFVRTLEDRLDKLVALENQTAESAGTIGKADQIYPASPKNGGFIDPQRH
jgi:hypothetical protein